MTIVSTTGKKARAAAARAFAAAESAIDRASETLSDPTASPAAKLAASKQVAARTRERDRWEGIILELTPAAEDYLVLPLERFDLIWQRVGDRWESHVSRVR